LSAYQYTQLEFIHTTALFCRRQIPVVAVICIEHYIDLNTIKIMGNFYLFFSIFSLENDSLAYKWWGEIFSNLNFEGEKTKILTARPLFIMAAE
jgi:hypothetical protein